MRILIAATFALLTLTGCMMSNYKPPVIDTPPGAEAVHLSRWWKSFDDPALNALIEDALKNNADIRIAAMRMEQADSALRVARSSLSPSLDLVAGPTRSQTSISTGTAIAGQPRLNTKYSAGFTSSYELDLWGRLASLRSAAAQNLKATAYQQQAVTNVVVAETARSYFALRRLDADEKLLQQILETRKKAAELQKSRLKAGLISADDYAHTESDLNSAASLLPPARAARKQAEIALAALTGRSPRELTETHIPRGQSIEKLVQATEIPAALPSDLLQRRPDVRAAEAQLLAADANVSEARAHFFPKISLTASVGGESSALSNVVGAAARTWSLAALATQPIFSLWPTVAEVDRAKSARQEAEISYQQAARQAYADALTALTLHRAARDALASAQKFYGNEQKSADFTEQKLKAGEISRLSLLDAEQKEFSAARTLLAARYARLASLIDVYQALGGGQDGW